jgi:hypothetical protein
MAELNIANKDILTIKKGIITHCGNSLGVMGGLAGNIKVKYPEVVTRYKKDLALGLLLGDCSSYAVNENLFIATMITQSEIGTHKVQTNLVALKSCLEKVKLMADFSKLQLYFPYFVGSGLAGGPTQQSKQNAWDVVSRLILEICPEAIICKLN